MNNTVSLKTKLIGDRKFYAQVVSVLLPIVIQNTVSNVVSLLDNVMVGAVGTLPMTSVAIVNQLLFVFYLSMFGGLAGSGIFSAQYAGAQDHEGVRQCFRFKWYTALGLVAVAISVFSLFPEQLIRLYLAENTSAAEVQATIGYAKEYFKIMLIGLLPFGVAQVYGNTLREMGETRLPMAASVAAIFVNLVFNYIFIFGNEGLTVLPFGPMGVAGAAIATVISRFVEMFIIVYATHKHSYQYPFIQNAYSSLRVSPELARSILKRGMPLLFNEFMWSSGMAVIMQCYAARGLEVVAATNIASTISNLFNVVFLAMGNAVGIMVGQQLGANEPERAKITVSRLLFLAVTVCLVIGSVMFAAAPLIPRIYNTTESVRSMARAFIRILAIAMPLHSYSHSTYFTLRSGGKTLITLAFDCGYIWCLAVPTVFCLANLTSIPILPLYFIAQTLEWVKCVVGTILIRKGVWINNIVENIDA